RRGDRAAPGNAHDPARRPRPAAGRARRPRRPHRGRPGRRARGGGRVIARLWRLTGLPFGRTALSVLVGALARLFGVVLLTAAGYLLSRAAEYTPVLALTTVIVTVRFFALARPLVRYFDRLTGHDLALRGLGRARARVYERIEPLAPAGLGSFRRGDLVS